MKIDANYQAAYFPESRPTNQPKLSIWERDISFHSGISLKDRQNFYQLLAILLDAGLNIMDCLEVLIEQASKKRMKQLLLAIQASLTDGFSLSDTFEQQKKNFSLFEIYNVRMGEQTGKMATILADMAHFYEKRIKLKRKVIQALTYPIAVIFIALLVLIFMIAFVVPMFKGIFDRFDADLPPITQFVLALSNGLLAHGWQVLAGIGMGLLLMIQFRKHPKLKHLPSVVLSKIPLLGSLMLKLQLARFCFSFSLLLKSKVNLDKTLLLLEQMTTFYPLKVPLSNIRQQVIEGQSLFETLSPYPIFPAFFKQIIRVGEKTARLDDMLEKLAARLEEESEAGISQLTQLLEPLLIVVLGVIVAVILISMYLPMFELSNAIG